MSKIIRQRLRRNIYRTFIALMLVGTLAFQSMIPAYATAGMNEPGIGADSMDPESGNSEAPDTETTTGTDNTAADPEEGSSEDVSETDDELNTETESETKTESEAEEPETEDEADIPDKLIISAPIPTPEILSSAPLATGIAVASGTCGKTDADALTWKIEDIDGVRTLTISGTGAMADYATWGNYVPWNSYKSTIKKIIVEDGVTYIGNNAFNSITNASNVEIGDDVTGIGANAFDSSGVESVTLPDGLTSMGTKAFYSCKKLVSVSLPGSLGEITTSSQNLFQGCSALTEITLGEGITKLGRYMFAGCTSLSDVTLPESLVTIDINGFQGCTSLESVSFNGDSIITIGNNAFAGCSKLKNITIPASVTSLGSQAFLNCTSLEETTIPGGVLTVPNQAFKGCSSLDELVINSGVTKIDYNSFEGCSTLSDVTLPSTLTTIGGSAFKACSSLGEIELPVSLTSIGSNAFQGCTSLLEIVIPDTVTSLGGSAFDGCSDLENVSLPVNNNFATLNGDLFKNCTSLTEITIPANVATFYNHTFTGCTSLEKITIGAGSKINLNQSNNTNYATNARNCFKPAVQGDYAALTCIWFEGSSLSSMTVNPNSFANLTALTTVRLPKSVTKLGTDDDDTDNCDAFTNCPSLAAIYFEEDATDRSTFFSNSYGVVYKRTTSGQPCGTLYYKPPMCFELDEDVTEITAETFAGKENVLTQIEIPARVTSIGEDAFKDFVKLATVTFEEGSLLTTVGDGAFAGCTSLTGIALPAGVTTLGDNVFAGTAITSIDLPASVTSFVPGTFDDCTLLANVNVAEANTVYRSDSGVVYLKSDGSIPYFVPLMNAGEIQPSTLTAGWIDEHLTEDQTSFEIQKQVTRIAANAFAGKNTLTSVVFAENSEITTIASNAFKSCTGLTSVIIPGTVTTLAYTAFSGCSALESVTIGTGGKGNGSEIYYSVDGVVYLEDGDIVWYQPEASPIDIWPINVTGEWLSLKHPAETTTGAIVIPKHVRTIDDEAFSGYAGLTAVTFEGGSMLETIGSKAFYGCTGLTEITLPASLSSFDNGKTTASFLGCTNLENIYVTDTNAMYNSVDGVVYDKETGDIFYQPEGSTIVLWPVNPTTAWISDADNFPKATTTSVTIPAYVRSLPEGAFNGYTNLVTVTFAEGSQITAIPKNAFNGCTKLATINLQSGVASIGDYAFQNCKKLGGITLPSTLTTIGTSAFNSCESITSVTLGSGITSIGGSAFASCYGLTSLTFEEGFNPTWSSNSQFGSCIGLTSIEFPASLTALPGSMFSCNSSSLPHQSKLKTVTFAEGSRLTTVGGNAFYQCKSLESIALPDSVTSVGENAFNGCSSLAAFPLTSNSQVNMIYGSAFYGCSSMAGTVTIPKGISAVYQNTFNGCANITAVVFPVDSRVTNIQSGAFSKCSKLASVTLPSGLTRLDTAFQDDAALTTVTLPASLSDLVTTYQNINNIRVYYATTFRGCTNLETVYVAEGNAYYYDINGAVYSYPQPPATSETPKTGGTLLITPEAYTGQIILPDDRLVLDSLYYRGNKKITHVVIPAQIKTIGAEAFKGCTSLETVEFESPDTLLTVKYSAFEGCTALTDITLPSSVKTIENKAFYNCNSMEQFTIPASIETIECDAWGNNGCFEGCTSLGSINIPATLTKIDRRTFYGCSALETLTFSAGSALTEVSASAFEGCTALTAAVFPDSLDKIGANAFKGCNSLATVTLPSHMTTIGQNAFSGCTALVNLTMPATMTPSGNANPPIASYAFSGCTSLQTVTVPSGVSDLLAGTFSDCTSLTTVNLPSTLVTIWDLVFDSCTSLEEIALPASVTSFQVKDHKLPGSTSAAVGTFRGCANLERVNIAAGNATYYSTDGVVFLKADNSLYYVPLNSPTDYWDPVITKENISARFDKATTTSITIPYYVTRIEGPAFEGFNSLQTVRFEADSILREVGSNAFKNCSALTECNLPDSVTTIGTYAFTGTSLNYFKCPAGLTEIPMYCFQNSNIKTFELSKTLTKIGKYAFKDSGLTTWTSPISGSALKTIDTEAFRNTPNLQAANIPEGVTTIGTNAFYGSGIRTLTVPQSVTDMSSSSFEGCINLTNAVVRAKCEIPWSCFEGATKLSSVSLFNITGVEDYAFKDCKALTTAVLPGTCRYINEQAFENCIGLTSITIPEGVTEIEDQAFANCIKLDKVTIPKSATNLGSCIFDGCIGLKELTVNSAGELDSGVFANRNYANYVWDGHEVVAASIDDARPRWTKSIEKITLANVTDLNNRVFYNFKNLHTVNIPSTVTWIGDNAFEGCESLTKITIPGSVEYINTEAFKGCCLLSTVTISNGVKDIDNYAFEGCSSLTQITIPDSVTDIYPGAFEDCTSLKKAVIGKNVTRLGYRAFYGCAALETVNIPTKINTIEDQTFYMCGALKNITIPNNITAIDDCAFSFCRQLSSVTIPGSVTSIGQQAFENCASLTSITIPSSVTTIEPYAFERSGLQSIIIPATVTNLGEGVFDECDSLDTATVNCRTLPDITFYNCAALTSVNIGSGVTSLDPGAFSGCRLLTTITVDGANTHYLAVNSMLYRYIDYATGTKELIFVPYSAIVIDENGVVTIPDGLVEIPTGAYEGNMDIRKVVIPASVKHIGDGAFTQSRVESVIFASDSRLESIGISAFAECYNLESISFTGNTSLSSVGQSAFEGCDSLSSFSFENNTCSVSADSSAFMYTYQLHSVTNGDGEMAFSHIGYEAFDESGLESVKISAECDPVAVYDDDYRILMNSLAGYRGEHIFVENGCTRFSMDDAGRLIQHNEEGSAEYLRYGATIVAWTPPVSTVYTVAADVTDPNGVIAAVKEGGVTYTAIEVAEGNTAFAVYDGALYNKDGTILYCVPTGAEGSFYVREGTQTLYQYSFRGCSLLRSIHCPYSLKTIGAYAFYDCQGLNQLYVPESVNNIYFKSVNDLTPFDACSDDLYIYGRAGSYVDQYLSATGLWYDGGDGHVYERTDDFFITDRSDKCRIIYALGDGEINDPGNPAYYASFYGEVVLKPAVKDGYEFGGWCTDPGLEHLITSLTPDNAWDYTLYPRWRSNVTITLYSRGVHEVDGVHKAFWFVKKSGSDDLTVMDSSETEAVTLENGVSAASYYTLAETLAKIDGFEFPTALSAGLDPECYSFGGWATADGTMVPADSVITENSVFYAVWNAYTGWNNTESRYIVDGVTAVGWQNAPLRGVTPSLGNTELLYFATEADIENKEEYGIPDSAVTGSVIGDTMAKLPVLKFDDNGETVTDGVNRKTYLLDGEGHIMTDWQKVDGVWYYFAPDTYSTPGAMVVSDFITVGNNTYYLKEDGTRAVGRTGITIADPVTSVSDTDTYYFNRKGVLQTGWISDGIGRHYYDPYNGGAMAAGTWVGEGKDRIYVDEEGNRKPAGAANIDGKEYYLDSNGQVRTGWIKVGEDWFYYNSSTENYGARITATDDNDPDTNVTMQIVISGRTYLIDEYGARQTGWIDSDGNGRNDRYYDAGGVLATGWKKIDGEWYYFFTGGEDHDPGEMATGLTVIDGKLYAMGGDGRRAGAGKTIDDIETGNGGSTSGITNRNGIVQIEEAGFIRTSDGSEVYVGENGKVVTDRWVQDTVQVSDGNGGTFEKTVDVYVGSDGKRETGITIIDGKVYALDDNGAVDDKVRDSMGSGWYKYDENGKLTEITGATPEELSTAIAATTDAIFVNDDGTICTGWINEGGKTYYYDESGHRVKSGTCKIGRKLYGFNESGELLQTGIYKQIEADDGQGGTVIKIQRIVTDNNAETGYTAAELNGTAYIVNSDGTIYTGWCDSNDYAGRYYFGKDDGVKATGVKKVGLFKYYFGDSTGALATTPGWTNDTDATADDYYKYYISLSGAVQTGWAVIGDKMYYFDKDGVRIEGEFKAGIRVYHQTKDGITD